MQSLLFYSFICGVKIYLLNKIKIGAVSYLNTKPLLFGLKRSGLMDKIDLIEDYPAHVAQMLLNNTIDIGLVPVAIIPQLKEAHVVTDFCIGAEKEVASVCLFSEVSIENIETVILDYQSKTSVNLAKVLLKEFWKKEVVFKEASEHFRNEIKGTTAAVVIGDRAFEQRNISAYVYDLAAAWKQYTGLPFVFAAWIANKPIDPLFVDAFNHANAYGLRHLEEVVVENPYTEYDLKKYYTTNISYQLTDAKRQGLSLFLEKIKALNALNHGS